jgi:RNA polymerase sigma factor (sigma-70 family)
MKIEHTYDDNELMALIVEPKNLNTAILSIYRQHAESVSSFIMSRGGSQQDAEDIFQDTVVAFIEVVKKGSFRQESSIRTFLTAIARNTWFNELNKRKRSGEREKHYESGREQQEEDVSHSISDREVKQQLRELLDQLGESCRKILILFYYENLSMREMLDQLPYENEQVVRNKKYKCLQQLTEIIKGNPGIASRISELIK